MADPTPDETPDETPARPLLQVVNPDATPEEVAAIVAVLSALGGGSPAPRRARPTWNHPARLVRQPVAPGHGGWRSSALPR